MLLGLPVMELPGFTSCTCKAGGGGDCRLRGDQGGGPQHTPGKAPPCSSYPPSSHTHSYFGEVNHAPGLEVNHAPGFDDPPVLPPLP